MMRPFFLCSLLSVLVTATRPAAAAELQVPLDAAQWHLSAPAAPVKAELRPAQGALQFWSEGQVTVPRSASWRLALKNADLRSFRYVVIEYQAEWIEKDADVLSVRDGAGGEIKMLVGGDLLPDGIWHRLIAKRALPDSAAQVQVSVPSHDSRAYLTLRSLAFASAPAPLGSALADKPGRKCGPEFRCIDLGAQFNSGYDTLLSRQLAHPKFPQAVDGGQYFRAEDVTPAALPFRVRPQGNNLVGPPPPPAANEETIENFGTKAKRATVAPVSRDGLIEVSVGAPASEVYLLLASGIPAKRAYFYVGEGPKLVTDVDEFAVELVYENGLRDLAFPYSVADRRHVIQRTLGVYAVPASGERLARVVVHNRSLDGDVHLAALTVNTGRKRLFPNLVLRTAPLAVRVAEPSARQPFATRSGDILHLGNRYLDLEIDAANAFSIAAFRNRWLAASLQLVSPQPGLEVRFENHCAELRLANIEPIPGGFDVLYRAGKPPLDLRASVSVGEGPQARFQLTVTNRSGAPLQAGIRFPRVSGLQLGRAEDLWYFFPKFRNAVGSAPATFHAQSGFAFPMQFFDLFDPRAGGGVYLLSKDLTHKAEQYFLAKDAAGGTFYLEYPALFTHLPPGEPYQGTETIIGVHPGDWHAAAKAYREWVTTWYRPYKAQQDSKAWYRQSFWLLCELADGLDHLPLRLPPWYDRTNKRYLMRDIIDEFSRDVGATPDLLHFWGWNWEPHRFGLYGEEQYNDMGGLASFRAALDDVQKNLKIPVSLYIDGMLCSESAAVCKQLAEECAIRGKDGSFVRPFDSYRMCPYTAKWRDYLSAVYPRVYRETRAPILYVDEVGSPTYYSDFVCWAPNHGHPVPLNTNEGDYALLKSIREAAPEEVVLYGEYPVTDITSQLWDCNISYQLTRWANLLGPSYDRTVPDSGLSTAQVDVWRFLFPRVVQLNLPISEIDEWQPLKQIFFNGEALYDSFWDRFQSKGQQFWTKAYRIMKEYRDCFASDTPETLVGTEHAAVAANRFPGNGRTVWTIYNQAYTTVRGPILAIDHFQGAVYRDLWAGRELTPVIRGGKALISLQLDPQGIGCIAQQRAAR
jgi:hypothetical protein